MTLIDDQPSPPPVYRISAAKAVGAVTLVDGRVAGGAPYFLRFMSGMTLAELSDYCEPRGWTIERLT